MSVPMSILGLLQREPTHGYELKRAGGTMDALMADHGLFHLEADLRWIDVTEARLHALKEMVSR